MLPLLVLFSLQVLVLLAEAASTNGTSESSAPDPTSSNYRSIWSILGTCALTLIICIWNATYPNITHEPHWYKVALYRVALGLVALVAPEVTTMRAYTEWRYAGEIQRDLSSHQWTRTHGFFVLMGGFILQDGAHRELVKTRYDLKGLRLDVKIMNPKITKKQIRDRSKSDVLGNMLLVLQLSWFILQVIARATNHLAITLVEIDTLALAALSLLLFFFWWNKPWAAECPHIFYTKPSESNSEFVTNPTHCEDSHVDNPHERSVTDHGDTRTPLIEDHTLSVHRRKCDWIDEITTGGLSGGDHKTLLVLLIVWMIFGALHMIAWDFQFPSHAEKIMWRLASLTLVGAPCVYFLAMVLYRFNKLHAVLLVLSF
ncbi:hypothetical protein PAXINDRAFT_100363 [Paxillus involutus ATCC 200175]|uniref:Uncharacterized protein n=1 Tax=Paxillus involutus ATCC 200175 TaxID=664439 RepID=A0A0C9TUT5_PAXIN|nr:hypothetical protein PAXINDRAFT_100363 [Paxillus involutus ATCC 200175]